MRTRSIGDTQGFYSHEEEVKAMNITMGNARTKSNGHGMDKPKDRDLE